MAHELFRLSALIFNTPHLMDPAAFETVAAYIARRTEEGKIDKELAVEIQKNARNREVQYNEDTGVGVIPVTGPLTYIEQTSLCFDANSSYQQIKNDFDALAKLGAKTIVFDTDGPGGQAYSCFETAAYLRSEADKQGIKLIAYVDGLAASATYAIACAAHEIVANPDAEIGSVGVLVKLRNINKAMQEMGIVDTYVTVGDSKIPFDASGDWKPDFLADLQEKVNVLYEGFVSHVAEMRGIDRELVKSTQAKTFLAEKAKELGLVERVMTREEFFEYLADVVDSRGDKMLGFKFNKQEDTEMVKLEELQTQLNELTAKFEATSADLAALQATMAEKEAEVAELTASLAEANSKLEAQAAAAAATKLEARKAELAAVLQEDKVDAMLSTVSSLDDAAFAVVIDSLKSKAALETTSPMFKELGDGGSTSKKETTEMSLLKAKYQKK